MPVTGPREAQKGSPVFLPPRRDVHLARKLGWNWAVMAVWINSAAAAWLSMRTDAADFCRYSRSRADMWIGTFLAAVLGQGISVSSQLDDQRAEPLHRRPGHV